MGNHFPACQPYEWYSSQMAKLEDLVLRYETFACVAGPSMCIAAFVGGILLLVQLTCCPMLLLGSWGGAQEAIFVLLATDEEVDLAVLSEAPRGTSAKTTCRPGAISAGKVEAE